MTTTSINHPDFALGHGEDIDGVGLAKAADANTFERKTKFLRFEGYSDDTFACTGPGIDVDRDNCANGKPISMRIASGDVSMIVTGQYCPGEATSWQIAVARGHDDDDLPMPAWAMGIGPSDRPYSPRLTVEVPDDAVVELLP